MEDDTVQGGFNKKKSKWQGNFTFMSRLWEDSQYTATMRFFEAQYLKYMVHNSRQLNDTIIKHVLYNNSFPDEGIPR